MSNPWKMLTEKQISDYYKTVNLHRKNVMEAGKKIGVPLSQLVVHDLSKFEEEEFPYYCRNFFGG